MKFALVLLALLATAFASLYDATNSTDSDMIVVSQETSYSFVVGTDDNVAPSSSDEVDAYIVSCLESSFNKIHDPTKYVLLEVEIESEDIIPLPKPALSTGDVGDWWKRYPWLWAYGVVNMTGQCRGCPINLMSTHDYPAWEKGFCKCLEKAPFEVIKTAKECKIERGDTAVIFEAKPEPLPVPQFVGLKGSAKQQ